jgi:hypothetical protein
MWRSGALWGGGAKDEWQPNSVAGYILTPVSRKPLVTVDRWNLLLDSINHVTFSTFPQSKLETTPPPNKSQTPYDVIHFILFY